MYRKLAKNPLVYLCWAFFKINTVFFFQEEVYRHSKQHIGIPFLVLLFPQ